LNKDLPINLDQCSVRFFRYGRMRPEDVPLIRAISLRSYGLSPGAAVSVAITGPFTDSVPEPLITSGYIGPSPEIRQTMIPLLLYYRSEKAAAKRLYEINRWAAPNTHVLYLIEEKFHLRGSLYGAIKAAEQGDREEKSYE
jgi:hypothetical protein